MSFITLSLGMSNCGENKSYRHVWFLILGLALKNKDRGLGVPCIANTMHLCYHCHYLLMLLKVIFAV